MTKWNGFHSCYETLKIILPFDHLLLTNWFYQFTNFQFYRTLRKRETSHSSVGVAMTTSLVSACQSSVRAMFSTVKYLTLTF